MLRFMVLHHECSHIRKSADITPICGSPQLIAACHVLLRLLMPRHSPYALVRLNFLSLQIFVRIFAELIVRSVRFSVYLNCLSFLKHGYCSKKVFLLALFASPFQCRLSSSPLTKLCFIPSDWKDLIFMRSIP